MKKSIKRITGAIMAAAIFAAMTVMSTTASASYIDGDREVDYYDFDIPSIYYNSDEWYPNTSPVVKRFGDRNWVISVNYVSTNQYPITYSVVEANDLTGSIATSSKITGTGNGGGRYASNRYEGHEIRMCTFKLANIPTNYFITSRGQWSPDAPY